MNRPNPSEHSAYFLRYVSLVEGDDVLGALEQQSAETQKLLSGLDDARAAGRYEPGKWSIKEVVGHLLDTERIMAYRALAIARGETQPLPSFDENSYAEAGEFDSWSLGDLAEQYALVRRANLILFRNLPETAWERRGTVSGNETSVRALVWVIAGHELHHRNVLRERYNVG